MSDNLPSATGDEPTGPRLCEETCLVADFEATNLEGYSYRHGKRDWWLNRFEYHPPHGNQAERYGRIRATGRAMTELILDLAPESDERTRALERLQEVIMLTNAAIACNEHTAA